MSVLSLWGGHIATCLLSLWGGRIAKCLSFPCEVVVLRHVSFPCEVVTLPHVCPFPVRWLHCVWGGRIATCLSFPCKVVVLPHVCPYPVRWSVSRVPSVLLWTFILTGGITVCPKSLSLTIIPYICVFSWQVFYCHLISCLLSSSAKKKSSVLRSADKWHLYDNFMKFSPSSYCTPPIYCMSSHIISSCLSLVNIVFLELSQCSRQFKLISRSSRCHRDLIILSIIHGIMWLHRLYLSYLRDDNSDTPSSGSRHDITTHLYVAAQHLTFR